MAENHFGAGYDIISTNKDGTERLIEIKSQLKGKKTWVHLTRKESEVYLKAPRKYWLYLVEGDCLNDNEVNITEISPEELTAMKPTVEQQVRFAALSGKKREIYKHKKGNSMKKIAVLLFAMLTIGLGAKAQAFLVADLNTGVNDSEPADLTVYDGKLYFSADDGVNGRELWSYDGVNTALEADILLGSAGSDPVGLTVYDGNLYFAASDGSANLRELWRYNGSTASLVANISPLHDSDPRDLTVYDGQLYFSASDTTSNLARELWRYNGSTVEAVTDMCSGYALGCISFLNPSDLIVYNGKLHYVGRYSYSPGVWSRNIMSYNGSANVVETDIGVGTADPQAKELTAYDGKLYFQAGTGIYSTGGPEFWSYNGFSTVLEANINPATSGISGSNPANFTVYNDKLYFYARPNNFTSRFYSYDGSDLIDVLPPGPQGIFWTDEKMVVYHDKLFVATTELKSYDGISYVTETDIATNGASLPHNLSIFNDKLFFAADDGNSGIELWSFNEITVGVANALEIGVNIYPNPNNGLFELVLQEFDNSSYKLFDSLGQLVAEGNVVSERTSINIQAFADGAYTLQVQTPEGMVTKKLFMQ
ncbi:MAG: DUF3883 domain-containing protein [Flavobacteriales bacterium]|nr:DUF3883 domain-containing protein [Flavobacteriales bacterium]